MAAQRVRTSVAAHALGAYGTMAHGLPPGPLVTGTNEPTRVSWRAVALPVEHGGWGLLGEPILVGLCLAPSRAGLGIAIAALAAFLARHPLKLALADWRRGSRYARTSVALRFVLVYALLAVAGLAMAGPAPRMTWIALLAAAPLGAVQLAYDARLKGRGLVPEILGGVALGSVAAAIMIAGGWSAAFAFAAWALLALKAACSVLYVRARLRIDRGLKPAFYPPLASHLGALVVAATLVAIDRAPLLSLFAFAVLTARAAYGLSRYHRVVRPRVVGFQELAFGLGFAFLLILGTRAGW